jgi:hypothetical protein
MLSACLNLSQDLQCSVGQELNSTVSLVETENKVHRATTCSQPVHVIKFLSSERKEPSIQTSTSTVSIQRCSQGKDSREDPR